MQATSAGTIVAMEHRKQEVASSTDEANRQLFLLSVWSKRSARRVMKRKSLNINQDEPGKRHI